MLLVFRTAAVFFVCDGERLERGTGGVSRARGGEGHTQSPPAPPPPLLPVAATSEWCRRPDDPTFGSRRLRAKTFRPRRPAVPDVNATTHMCSLVFFVS